MNKVLRNEKKNKSRQIEKRTLQSEQNEHRLRVESSRVCSVDNNKQSSATQGQLHRRKAKQELRGEARQRRSLCDRFWELDFMHQTMRTQGGACPGDWHP